MDNQSFANNILAMIERCSSNFFLIAPNQSIQCSCVDHTTKQSDPSCKKCLGTGYKIKITKIRGACYEQMKGGATLSSKTSRITRTYYIDNKYTIHENDFIVDNNEIYYVYRLATMRGLGGLATHKEITSVLKSEDHDKVYNNFLAIINKKLTPNQRGDFPWLI